MTDDGAHLTQSKALKWIYCVNVAHLQGVLLADSYLLAFTVEWQDQLTPLFHQPTLMHRSEAALTSKPMYYSGPTLPWTVDRSALGLAGVTWI